MLDDIVYLDNNATTPLLPEVGEAMRACAQCQHGNPASQHEPGRRARRVLESARDRIANLLGAKTEGMDSDQLVFTSGATEANNLALRGLAGGIPGRILISAVEHPSVVGTAKWLAQQGFDVQVLRVDDKGVVDIQQLGEMIDDQTRLVSVMLGNNETGVIQPVRQLADICNRADVPLHTDAVQVAGKLPVCFRELGVATLSISAHKFHGPCGTGALLVRNDCALSAVLHGGFQQAGLRPGTESVELAVGMQTALDLADRQQPPHGEQTRGEQLAELRDRLETQLLNELPNIVVHAADAQRLPQTSNISFLDLDRQAIVMALDLAGVACSTGSACASGSSDPSPTLLAMGCRPALYNSAVRFSVGALNTPSQIDRASRRIVATINDLRRQPSRSSRVEPARRQA